LFKQTTSALLRRHFDVHACLRWFIVGAVLGMCAWRWGTSQWPIWGLKLSAGFGAVLILLLVAATMLGIVAHIIRGRTGVLAFGDFRNLQPWMLSKLLRTTSVFAGMVAIAALWWCATGSGNALNVVLAGSLLGSVLAYIWCCLVLMAADLGQLS
jgi:hypothetical protein